MKLTVDKGRCVGSAFCISVIPDLVDFDADGKATAHHGEIPASMLADAANAVADCPVLALRLSPD